MILLLLLKDISFLFGAVFVAELLPTAPLLLLNYYSSVAQSTLLLKTQKRGDLIERATAMCSLRLWPWNDQKSVCKPRVQLIYEIIKKKKLLVLTLRANNKSQLNANCPLLSGYSRIVLIAVWCLVMLSLSLGRETMTLICWLLPAEGGHLPGKRRSSVWVAQQDATTARTSIEQLNLSFKGKSKRA